MKNINDKPLLQYSIDRVKMSTKIDKLVVATSTNSENDIIEQFCKDNNVNLFRGSEDDVLDRYFQCAKLYEADIIIRLNINFFILVHI